MNCFGCGKKTKNISGWCDKCYDKDDCLGSDYDDESKPEIIHPDEELYQYYLDEQRND